jgi:hypothetical protein
MGLMHRSKNVVIYCHELCLTIIIVTKWLIKIWSTEEKRAPKPEECMAKICLERRQSALFTVTGKYRQISKNSRKYKAVHILHYIIQRRQKGITTTFTDFIAAGFLNRDFSCTQNWDRSTFAEFISTPVLCYISLQLQEHLWGGSAKVKLLDHLFLLIVKNHDWSLKI